MSCLFHLFQVNLFYLLPVRQYVTVIMIRPRIARGVEGGQTCCWREQVPGKILGETKCQTCKNYKDANGNTYEKCTDPAKQAIKPEGETTGPQQGGVLEDPSNLPELQGQIDSKRADILADLNDNNLTFAEANNTDND